MSQLPLPLSLPSARGGQDFLVGDGNALAVAWIGRWPDWPGPGLVLTGPAGCGKSHLAAHFAERSGAAVLDDAAALSRWLEQGGEGPVVLDPADAVAAHLPEALLHLIERQKASRHAFLLTGRLPPSAWAVPLRDLESRLKALPVVAIAAPDDMLLAGLIVKLFADRQLTIAPEVIAWLLPRIERSHAAAVAAVAAIDTAALAAGRAVTLPLVRRIFSDQLS